MRERILTILNRTEGISGYRINTVKTTSYELFFVHKNLETVRSTDTADIKVTVYVKHGDYLGDSTFPVYASYTDDEIEKAIGDAARKAAVIDNPAYELPAEGEVKAESDADAAEIFPKELAAKIADAVFEVSDGENGSVNALEIFLNRNEVNVVNSCGTDKSEIRNHVMIEAIPTWNGDGESVEIYENYQFTEFNAAELSAQIGRKMQEVRNRSLAKKPEAPLKCNVVLNAQELMELAFTLTDELNYASVYNRTNAYETGRPIQQDPTGDRLTVTMKGRMKGSVRSALFDLDGTEFKDTVVIERGMAANYYGASRFAQYLNRIPTGNLPCVEVKTGTLTEEELHAEPYFECVSMSGLQLDIYNDYIGGEVRLAYYFDGEKKIPLTGISISGKLSEALKDLRLSQRETVCVGYKGPEKAIFKAIEII